MKNCPHWRKAFCKFFPLPINQTRLKQCLIQADIKAATGEGFDSVTKNEGFKLLRPALDTLLEQNLLEGKNRSYLL